MIADDVIRDLVAAEPQGRPVVVVTSDQEVVRDVVRGRGAGASRRGARSTRLLAAVLSRSDGPKLSEGAGTVVVSRHVRQRLTRE